MKDKRITDYVAERTGWTYKVTSSGHHEVRDQFDGLQARNRDADVVLEILVGHGRRA